jgi:hypothetical protein
MQQQITNRSRDTRSLYAVLVKIFAITLLLACSASPACPYPHPWQGGHRIHVAARINQFIFRQLFQKAARFACHPVFATLAAIAMADCSQQDYPSII